MAYTSRMIPPNRLMERNLRGHDRRESIELATETAYQDLGNGSRRALCHAEASLEDEDLSDTAGVYHERAVSDYIRKSFVRTR